MQKPSDSSTRWRGVPLLRTAVCLPACQYCLVTQVQRLNIWGTLWGMHKNNKAIAAGKLSPVARHSRF